MWTYNIEKLIYVYLIIDRALNLIHDVENKSFYLSNFVLELWMFYD
jgi:hypothetical protein